MFTCYEVIESNMKLLMQMSITLTRASRKSVICIGRMSEPHSMERERNHTNSKSESHPRCISSSTK